jgi:hypothetical protein
LERWLREPETILADIQAAQAPKRKATDPLPLWRNKALQEGYARWRAKQKRDARNRTVANGKARNIAKRMTADRPIWVRMLLAMEPGEWYGIRAIGRAIGIDRGSAFRVKQTLTQRGLIERAANPAWDGRRRSPYEIMAGAVQEPQWLYRLTPEGECARVQ